MKRLNGREVRWDRFFALVLPFSLMLVATSSPAISAGCAFESQGEGRVTEIIDARSFRLEDGREIRLAGIEPVFSEKVSSEKVPSERALSEKGLAEKSNRTAALSAILRRREVTLSGDDDTPDRYGRQPAFVFLASSDTPIQALLLAQ